MRPIVCIHGVSAEKDARGFSDGLRAEIKYQCEQLQVETPRWAEVVWSDLMDLPGDFLTAPLDVLADVVRYEHDGRMRMSVHARLRAALLSFPRAVLVAHSLGSVIALDCLALHRNLRPTAFVTMGSPLGIDSAVAGFTWRVGHSRGAVEQWVDFWSPLDPIVTGEWPPGNSIIDGAQGLASVGYECESLRVDMGCLMDPYSAHTGYWRSPQVAARILALASEAA